MSAWLGCLRNYLKIHTGNVLGKLLECQLSKTNLPDRSGHSCETKSILVDVAIEHNESLSSQFPGLRKEDRHGFTLVLTAWRHAARDSGECEETEMVCPNTDGGAHRDTSHCIWQKMYCDGHQVRPACCIITEDY